MHVEILPDGQAATDRVVTRFREQLARKPASVLGLATGGTMEPVYEGLIKAYRAGDISFAAASSFNLDEYVGLLPDHPQSYQFYMRERLFRHVDFRKGATHVPEGGRDPEGAALAYEALIETKKPVSLQLLGVGNNGHIGFNEPGSSFRSRTRVVSLAPSTLVANSRFFGTGERQPETAITMGIGTILEAEEIVLLALGEGKADIVAEMIEGPVREECPASVLQRHANTRIILDAAAASKLKPCFAEGMCAQPTSAMVGLGG